VWMAACLVTGVLALAFPGSGSGWTAAATLAPPWNLAAVAGQGAFYILAAVGGRLSGPLGKVAYVPRFLWDSNLAAARGMARAATGKQTPLWERVARREEPPA